MYPLGETLLWPRAGMGSTARQATLLTWSSVQRGTAALTECCTVTARTRVTGQQQMTVINMLSKMAAEGDPDGGRRWHPQGGEWPGMWHQEPRLKLACLWGGLAGPSFPPQNRMGSGKRFCVGSRRIERRVAAYVQSHPPASVLVHVAGVS